MKIKFAVYESCVGESHYIGRYYRPRVATLFSMEIYSSTIISLETELICVQ